MKRVWRDARDFSSAGLNLLGESGRYFAFCYSRLSRLKQDEVRVPNYESGGQEFESLRARHFSMSWQSMLPGQNVCPVKIFCCSLPTWPAADTAPAVAPAATTVHASPAVTPAAPPRDVRQDSEVDGIVGRRCNWRSVRGSRYCNEDQTRKRDCKQRAHGVSLPFYFGCRPP